MKRTEKACIHVCVHVLSHVGLFATSWMGAHQAPLSLEFSNQKYCSGLPFPTPRALPNPGVEFVSPALAGEFFTSVPAAKPGKAGLYFKRRGYLRGIVVEFWVIVSRMKVAGIWCKNKPQKIKTVWVCERTSNANRSCVKICPALDWPAPEIAQKVWIWNFKRIIPFLILAHLEEQMISSIL